MQIIATLTQIISRGFCEANETQNILIEKIILKEIFLVVGRG